MSTTDVTNRLQEAEREWEERTLDPTLKRRARKQEEFYDHFACARRAPLHAREPAGFRLRARAWLSG